MSTETIIETEKALGAYHCGKAFAKGGESLARQIPPTLSSAGAQAWAAELARLLDEKLAAEMRSAA